MRNPFASLLFRCHSFGRLMTNLNSISEKGLETIKELEERARLAEQGKAKPLTANMEATLGELIAKRDMPDVLPTGAQTYCDEIFRAEFWGRKRVLENKYLHKGLFQEEDSIDIIGHVTNDFLAKNTQQFSNKFLIGTPDVLTSLVRDAKSCWDLESFDNASLSIENIWQTKGYCWLTKRKEASVDKCLVNTPLHLLDAEKLKLSYSMNNPDQENDNWKKNVRQLERNMIFDVALFKKENPYYDFENEDLNFSIPKHMRIKSFKVELIRGDIRDIKMRVTTARKYLKQKFEDTVNKMESAYQTA